MGANRKKPEFIVNHAGDIEGVGSMVFMSKPEAFLKVDVENDEILSSYLQGKQNIGESKSTFYTYSSRLIRLRNELKKEGLDFFPDKSLDDNGRVEELKKIADIIKGMDMNIQELSIVRSFYKDTSVKNQSPFCYIPDARLSRVKKRINVPLDTIKKVTANLDIRDKHSFRDLALVFLFVGTELKANEIVAFDVSDFEYNSLRDEGSLTREGKVVMLHPYTSNMLNAYIKHMYPTPVQILKTPPLFPSFSVKVPGSYTHLTKQGCFLILKQLTGETTPYIDVEEFNSYLDTLV